VSDLPAGTPDESDFYAKWRANAANLFMELHGKAQAIDEYAL